MNRDELLRAADRDLKALREQNARERERRLLEAIRRDPEIEPLAFASQRILSGEIRRLLADPEGTDARMAEARARAREAGQQLRARLIALQLPETYLDPIYECALCQDTGRTGDGIKRECVCLKRRIHRLAYGNGAPIDRENFAAFDESLLPDTPLEGLKQTQRSLTLHARDACVRWIEDYPDAAKSTLVLCGEAGLGKTFLLNCLFARGLERGIDARLITSYQLFEAMRARHMGREADKESFDALIDTPLLLIDDLGAEPLVKNITIEYFFLLLNERSIARRHTAVATNLFERELLARYGERVFSRLFDRSHCIALQLRGKDLRFLKKG